MRALIVTNMWPSEAHPARGGFVRDQVQALERIPDVSVEVFAFGPGGIGAYRRAAADLRRGYAPGSFDVVHAHFGLSAWPALAVRGARHVVTLHGTDLAHPRSRPISLAALRFMDLTAAVSEELAGSIPRWAPRHPVAVLPCGVNMERFAPIPRVEARAMLRIGVDEPCLLFPADPARPEKRHDLALAVAGDVRLLTLGGVHPSEVALRVNAANAVLVPSDREGFGLAVLEALCCDVPVLATPHGVAPEALAGIEGTLCAPFAVPEWRAALEPHLAARDPRVVGRDRASAYSSDRMAERVVDAWRGLLS